MWRDVEGILPFSSPIAATAMMQHGGGHPGSGVPFPATPPVVVPESALPKTKIELPKPGDDASYGGTRTVREAYSFDVSSQIGEGTYGQVFRGHDKNPQDGTQAEVALKKIRMDTEKEGFPITAIREIKILSSMQHDNVVNLREIVRSDIHKNNNFKGSIYMVFDYAENDLTGLMDTNKFRFTEAQVKCIMKQLLRGLAYVHGNGVLHRDLKASNILIDKNGVVKLADFGLARTYQERQDSRLTNRVITLWYRPPELLLGAEKYGPEVDMWSVGAIFAELLVGKPLFPGSSEMDQIDKIFSVMGTPTEATWPGVTSLSQWQHVPKNKYTQPRLRGWLKEMAARTGQREPKAGAVDLLEKLLALDPSKRLLAMDAFRHEWFWKEDPPPCDPADLPCKGTSHEFTMKRRRQEQKDHHPAPGAGGGGGGMYPGGGGPGGHGGHHGPGGHGGMQGPPHGAHAHGQPPPPVFGRGPYPGGGHQGGGGGGHQGPPGGYNDPNKRQRYGMPPAAGGVSGGYGGGQRGPGGPPGGMQGGGGYGGHPHHGGHGAPPGHGGRPPYGGHQPPPGYQGPGGMGPPQGQAPRGPPPVWGQKPQQR